MAPARPGLVPTAEGASKQANIDPSRGRWEAASSARATRPSRAPPRGSPCRATQGVRDLRSKLPGVIQGEAIFRRGNSAGFAAEAAIGEGESPSHPHGKSRRSVRHTGKAISQRSRGARVGRRLKAGPERGSAWTKARFWGCKVDGRARRLHELLDTAWEGSRSFRQEATLQKKLDRKILKSGARHPQAHLSRGTFGSRT